MNSVTRTEWQQVRDRSRFARRRFSKVRCQFGACHRSHTDLRDTEARLYANVNHSTLRPVLTEHAARKFYLMTDDSPVYSRIGKEYAGHRSVNHSVSEAHLYRYLEEFDFRHNTRQSGDKEIAAELLRRAKGCRLTYHQPREAKDA